MKKEIMIFGIVAALLCAPFIFAASSDTATTSAAVTNVLPLASSANLNGNTDITLDAYASVWINGTVLITDNNGCVDIDDVNATLHMSHLSPWGGTYSGRDYYNASCSPDGVNACTGNNDLDESYICWFEVWYFANATDASAHQSGLGWNFTAWATDLASGMSGEHDTTNQEMNSLVDLNITELAIAYGELELGHNSTNNGTEMQNVTMVNQGNLRLDMEISATNMSCTIGNLTAFNVTRLIEGQYYSMNHTVDGAVYGVIDADLEVGLAARDHQIGSINAQYDLNTATSMVADSDDLSFWQIGLPDYGVGGNCAGVNTITGMKES